MMRRYYILIMNYISLSLAIAIAIVSSLNCQQNVYLLRIGADDAEHTGSPIW